MKRKFVVLVFLAVMVQHFFVSGIFVPLRIDSNSMAPSFPGPAYRFQCEDCDSDFEIGANESSLRPRFTCPRCGFMENELNHAQYRPGSRIFLKRFSVSNFRRFDAVVFRDENQPTHWVLKRIAALPGESVSLRNGNLYINGQLYRKTLPEQEKTIVPYPFGSWRHESTPHEECFVFDPREPVSHYRTLLLQEERIREQEFSFFSTRNPYNQAYGAAGNAGVESGEVFLRFPLRFLECKIVLHSKHGKIEIQKENNDHVSIRYQEETRTAIVPVSKIRFVRISLVDETFRLAFDNETLVGFPLSGESVLENEPAEMVLAFIGAKNARFGKSEFEENVQISLDPYIEAAPEKTWTVPQGHYFMLGDNTAISRDSRAWETPFVCGDSILGIPYH